MDETAFLAEIASAPEVDGPRLVFADWLEERGDLRGEFIRLQCQLTRLDPDHPQYAALLQRQRQLQPAQDAAWRYQQHGKRQIVGFERGLPLLEIATTARNFLKKGAEWLPAEPVLPGLGLNVDCGRLEDLEALARCPWLGRFERLRVATGFVDLGEAPYRNPWNADDYFPGDYTEARPSPVLPLLLASPYLGRVRALGLHGLFSLNSSPAELAAWSGWPRLTALSLQGNRLWPTTLAPLLQDQPPGLRRLVLSRNPVGVFRVQFLADWPGAAQLTHLDLQFTGLMDPDGQLLAQSPHLARIRELDLRNNYFRTYQGSPVIHALRQRFGRRVRLS